MDTPIALFLDFDGTLVEIAPRPDLVRVEPDLVPMLQALRARLDGALYYRLARGVEAQLNVENLAGRNYYPTAHNDNNLVNTSR